MLPCSSNNTAIHYNIQVRCNTMRNVSETANEDIHAKTPRDEKVIYQPVSLNYNLL